MINCAQDRRRAPTATWTRPRIDRPWGNNNPRFRLYARGSGQRSDSDRHRSTRRLLRGGVDCRRRDGERRQPVQGRRSAGQWRCDQQPGAGVLARSAPRPSGPAGAHHVDRGDHRQDGHDGDRTRLHRPARPGRAEPPRTQGGHPDSRRRAHPVGDDSGRHARAAVLLGLIMQHTSSLPRVGVARRTMLRVAVGLIVALGIVGAPRTRARADRPARHHQAEPVDRRPRRRHAQDAPAWSAVDTSLRMQFDADGNYYDPYDYTTGNACDTTLGISGAATEVPPHVYRPAVHRHRRRRSSKPRRSATVGNNSATACANVLREDPAGRARRPRSFRRWARTSIVRPGSASSACGRTARRRSRN